MVLLTGCSKDEIITLSVQESNKGRIIYLTASMPENDATPTTRVALEQEGLNIKLK